MHNKMLKFLQLCTFLVLFAVCRGVHTIKGLYCQDPDSGKLYAVNSTWRSQTFCGNYTCKLRKRNITETQYAPIKLINISKFDINNEDEMSNDMTTSPSENALVITKKAENEKQPIFHKDLFKAKDAHPSISTKPHYDGDRYLTESEIKTITDMLHTVKKSDLEAIVDIYNLAQDIYKEIDSESTEKLMEEATSEGKSEKIETKATNNKQSFWYEPLNNKHIDLSHQATDPIPTKKPYESNPTFFKGPLTEKDFGKLPYYYPISNFQRLSSYMHSKTNTNDLENAPTEEKPCKKANDNYKYVAIPWYNGAPKKQEPQVVHPSTLLPYPFSYVYHYNVSGYPSNYYYNYPWAVDYNRHRNYQQYLKPYYAQAPSYATLIRADPVKEDEKPKGNELLDKLTKKPAEKVPEWQTDPLSEKVLDEVRAHILDKPKALKPISLRKNVKLERVGKVIKLDELTRSKREIAEEEESDDYEYDTNDFEAYLVKTTCENSTELGFFSMGNLTEPYPACCPQKIDNFTIVTARNIKT